MFAHVGGAMQEVLDAYVAAVHDGPFPKDDNVRRLANDVPTPFTSCIALREIFHKGDYGSNSVMERRGPERLPDVAEPLFVFP